MGCTWSNLHCRPLKAKKTGEETLSIAGREIPAEIYEWEEVNEAGPMTVTVVAQRSNPR
jgi:hypothetical protein